jgi:hypothetical protein
MYLSYNAVNKFLQVHIVVYLHVSCIQKDFVLLGVMLTQLFCHDGVHPVVCVYGSVGWSFSIMIYFWVSFLSFIIYIFSVTVKLQHVRFGCTRWSVEVPLSTSEVWNHTVIIINTTSIRVTACILRSTVFFFPFIWNFLVIWTSCLSSCALSKQV